MDEHALPLTSANVPAGIYFIWRVFGKDFGFHEYRRLVLVLTFVAYACFHASRKPLSIVKGVMDPEATSRKEYSAPSPAIEASIGWDPFSGDLGEARLGEIDMAFLASYAIGMYFTGALGDRLDLRRFLTFGMVGSGIFVLLFGLGYWWNVHSFSYYFVVQVVTGLLSAIGWPAVVAVVANWFAKGQRGLVMGIWNAHASVGNICGSLVAAAALQYGWGWSFFFPALAIILCGLTVFFLLVVEPAHLGLPSPQEVEEAVEDEKERLLADKQVVTKGSFLHGNENDSLSPGSNDMPVSSGLSWEMAGEYGENLEDSRILEAGGEVMPTNAQAIGCFEAWRIPGVAVFAISLFFVKLVAYTFLYWLPFYIRHTEIGGRLLSDKMAGYLSTIFDIGGVIGGILAGHLSDKFNVKAIVAVVLVDCAIPSLYLFRVYGSVSLVHAVGLMILTGIFVNGPYALITTAVSADLGSHSSLKGNAKALATVTAIIDGTGSVGAAIGPFLTGYIALQSWTGVFMMLALSSLIAGLLLTKLVVHEIKEMAMTKKATRTEEQEEELRGSSNCLSQLLHMCTAPSYTPTHPHTFDFPTYSCIVLHPYAHVFIQIMYPQALLCKHTINHDNPDSTQTTNWHFIHVYYLFYVQAVLLMLLLCILAEILS